MKNIFKKNQMIITALAIMIAVAGYLNFAGNKIDTEEVALEGTQDATQEVADISAEDIYAQLNEPDSQDVDFAGEVTDTSDIESYDLDLTSDAAQATSGIAENDGEIADTSENTETPGEAVLTGAVTNISFIAEAKLTREQVRAKNKELLLEVIDNTNVDESARQEAVNSMIAMTDISERETAAELLLEAKGFTDVVVSITDDTADVVINMNEVTDAKRAQIEDIMKRKTGVSAENIVITPINVADTGE